MIAQAGQSCPAFSMPNNLLKNNKKELTNNVSCGSLGTEVREMKTTSVRKLARVVRVIMIVVFVCDILLLFFAPELSVLLLDDGTRSVLRAILDIFSQGINGLGWLLFLSLSAWGAVWQWFDRTCLTLFLLIGGICIAVILWQAKRVLDTVAAEEPFSRKNAGSMMAAAVCSFVIFAAALFLGVNGVCYHAELWGGLDYNAGGASIMVVVLLSGLLFLLVGLVFLVMSILFRQAAELKAENDLTI